MVNVGFKGRTNFRCQQQELCEISVKIVQKLEIFISFHFILLKSNFDFSVVVCVHSFPFWKYKNTKIQQKYKNIYIAQRPIIKFVLLRVYLKSLVRTMSLKDCVYCGFIILSLTSLAQQENPLVKWFWCETNLLIIKRILFYKTTTKTWATRK